MLNALTTVLPGSCAWSSSAIEVEAPAGSGVGRFETSTTTLPAADVADLLRDGAEGAGRNGEDDEVRRVDGLVVRRRGAGAEIACGLGRVLRIGGGEGDVVAGAHE